MGSGLFAAEMARLRWAGHLLMLAKNGVPDGSHLHLEESNGLAGGSVGLVLERSEEEGLYVEYVSKQAGSAVPLA